MVPKRIFFTKGVGKHKERLTSFELALRDAGVAAQNLVRVSSIFPPQCKLIARSQGLTYPTRARWFSPWWLRTLPTNLTGCLQPASGLRYLRTAIPTAT